MVAHPSSGLSFLGPLVAGSAAVAAICVAQSWMTKSILQKPINVKIIQEQTKVRRGNSGRGRGNPGDWGGGYPGGGWGDEVVEKEPELDLLPTMEPCPEDTKKPTGPPPPRYCRLEQIRNPETGEYEEYSAPPPRKVPDDDQLLHWFKVFSRRETTDRNEKPVVSVEFYSRSLVNFLRTVYGGQSSFRNHPRIGVHALFPFRATFSECLQKMELDALEKLNAEAKRERANSLGVPDIFKDDMDESILLEHLEMLSRQLKELVACLNKEFEPIIKEIEMYLSHGHIVFDLLDYMFQPGCKLLMYDDITGDKISVRMTSNNFEKRDNKTWFIIHGTGRAWNGSEYIDVNHTRQVVEWGGTRSVASLPWSALSDEDQQELVERGRIYCQYSGIYHVYNDGPLGGRGRAMVDGQKQHLPVFPQYAIAPDYYGDDEPLGGREGAMVDNQKQHLPNGKAPELPEDDLCLLPPTVTGFMLRKKEWVTMHVLSLRPVEFDRNAWDHLVLDPDTKLLIRSLVDVTCKDVGKGLLQDVITGKGGGLVSVLHGKPGTGKTLTAEAVAEHLERPIYIVGSEELPFDAGRLESRLRTILDLASRWDAVLLIDEADVFLEQRSMHELERNAVVAVALRLLEYHSGVLFLTTNRIKSFDEAFLSRFSIGIKYPDLDQASRLKIWLSFLRMASVEVVEHEKELCESATDGKPRICMKDLQELAKKSFNGRSIKNLLRTAQALALANNEPLAIQHLRIVVRTSERFLHDFEEIQGPGA